MKRNIRLKEWGVLVDEFKEATPAYVEGTDGSLETGQYQLRTDIRGFIKTGAEAERQGFYKRVLLGDSFVESLFIPEKSRFAALAEEATPGGQSIQIWNGGYSGANTLHIFNIIINKVLPLRHVIKQLIIFTTINDCYPATDDNGFWTTNSKATRFVGSGLKEEPRNECDPDFEQYRALVQSIIELCNIWGISLVFVRVPYRRAEFSSDVFLPTVFRDELQYQAQTSLMDRLADVCEEQSRLLKISFWNGFEAFPAEDNKKYFYDFSHLNVDGQVLFGDWLKTKIEETNGYDF